MTVATLTTIGTQIPVLALKPAVPATPKVSCIPTSTKTNIGVRYSINANNAPGNPSPYLDSYQDFTVTKGKFYCTNNSAINISTSTATPTAYRKAMYALKLATNSSPVPAPTASYVHFKPFNWLSTGNCSATQVANGYKMDFQSTFTVNSTSATIKLCRDYNSGGIGDDARMKSVIKQTLSTYYAPNLTTLILKDRYGNVI